MRTMLGLFRSPGQVCLEYVQGKRARYLSPTRYFLVMITLFVLIHWLLSEPLMPQLEIKSTKPGDVELVTAIKDTLSKYINFILLAALPVFTLFVQLLFRKSGYNYAEVSCFVFYVITQQFILGLLPLPVKMIDAQVYTLLRVVVQIGYFAWAAKVFFDKSWFHATLKSVFASILYMNIVGIILLTVVFMQR